MIGISINEVIRDYYKHIDLELTKYLLFLQNEKKQDVYDLTNLPLDVNVIKTNIEEYSKKIDSTEKKQINNTLEYDSMNFLEYWLKYSEIDARDVKDIDKQSVIENIDYFNLFFEKKAFNFFATNDLTYLSVMNDFHELYLKMYKEDTNTFLISQENKLSKPSTLHFLAKNKCQVGKIAFYSQYTYIWEIYDLIITANPTIIASKPKNKKVIKIETPLNKDLKADKTINKLKELL